MATKPARRVTPARRTQVDALLEQINAEVVALPGHYLAPIRLALQDAERELVRDLRVWLAREDGEAQFTAQSYRRALLQVRGALDRIDGLSGVMDRALQAGGKAALRTAQDHLQRELAEFSRLFEGSLIPIPISQAALIAQGERTLMRRYSSSAVRYAGAVGDDVRRQMAVGLVRGETVFQMTARIARLNPWGGVAVQAAGGSAEALAGAVGVALNRRWRWWAERLVRTEVIHSYGVYAEAGIREAAQHKPGLVRRWNAAIDRRTCPLCRELDGKTAEIGAKFMGEYESTPAHPCCRCAIVAWHPSWSE